MVNENDETPRDPLSPDEVDMRIAHENLAELTAPSSRARQSVLDRLERAFAELNVSSIDELSGREARSLVWLAGWEDSTMDGLVALFKTARAWR